MPYRIARPYDEHCPSSSTRVLPCRLHFQSTPQHRVDPLRLYAINAQNNVPCNQGSNKETPEMTLRGWSVVRPPLSTTRSKLATAQNMIPSPSPPGYVHYSLGRTPLSSWGGRLLSLLKDVMFFGLRSTAGSRKQKVISSRLPSNSLISLDVPSSPMVEFIRSTRRKQFHSLEPRHDHCLQRLNRHPKNPHFFGFGFYAASKAIRPIVNAGFRPPS
jgi:hypothetical protein